jgi:hypothetical protein
MSAGAFSGLTPAARSATAPKPVAPPDSFDSSSALEMALNNTSDIRPEALARGLDLVNDSNYPSSDTVKKLSDFLAGQLQSGQE